MCIFVYVMHLYIVSETQHQGYCLTHKGESTKPEVNPKDNWMWSQKSNKNFLNKNCSDKIITSGLKRTIYMESHNKLLLEHYIIEYSYS